MFYSGDILLTMINANTIILTQSEYDSLLRDIAILRDRVAKLTALRDDLIYHICPSLESEYEEKIACLERELLAAQLYLREKQRILEILQAQMNQNQEPSYTEAEQRAREENEAYQEDLNRKAREAKDSQDRWRKESNWYEYDKADRTRGEGDGEMGSDSKGPDQQGKKAEDEHTAGRGQDSRDRIGRDGDSSDRIGQDKDEDKEKDDKISAVSKIKKLYRKIVKLLHPDVHPNPTPKEKELLNRAIEAYNRGDLETIRKIWDELSGSGLVEEETFSDTPEDIARMKEALDKLRKRCRDLQEEIDRIRSSYPYTMKAFLDDEEAVRARQDRLHAEIDQTREMDRKLGEYIDELKKQMGHV